jgi:uncharacterized protein YukE
MKYYTPSQLAKKYKGKFINTYPHHYEYWNEDTNQYQTVYEVREVSDTIKENCQTVEEILYK